MVARSGRGASDGGKAMQAAGLQVTAFWLLVALVAYVAALGAL
jgi:hypothetical protein